MELKPGYKQTEVGIIPEDWSVTSLGELGTWKGGMTPSMQNPAFWMNGSVPWISSGDVKTARLAETGKSITEVAVKQGTTTLLPANSILIVMRSGILRKYLPVATNTIPMAINQDIKALIPNRELSGDFLMHALIANGQNILSRCMKSGTTVESVEFRWLKAFKLSLPPLPEQRAIATALSDMDALLAGLGRLIAKKRDLKQATMQALLNGRVRLPGFNGRWEVKRLESVAPLQRGFDLPNPELRSGPYPVVYSNGVLNHHAHFQAQGPGVVTGRSGTIGKVTYVEGQYWPHNTALWVTSFKNNNPRFIFYLYTQIGFERFATGSGVPTLNRNDVHSFEVAIPPTNAEQTAIAAVLTDMDAEIAALEQRRRKTQDLKQAMMQELLTGRTRLI